MNTHTTSTSEPRQLRIDWTAATKRKLLSRLAAALQGKTLGDPARPKERIKGSTIDLVLQGLHGWTISEGSTDRTPSEICGSLSEPTVRRVLAFLQSSSAESCVVAESFRYRNSPRVRRSICWSNLEAWCELLEAGQEVVVESVYPIAAIGSPYRSERVTLSQREGHPIAGIGSYKEDGPETVQTVPSTEPAERMSEAEADQVEEITRGGREGDGKAGSGRLRGVQAVCFDADVDRSRRSSVVDLSRRPASHSSRPVSDPTPGSVPGPVRSEIERILKDQLGVEAAARCVEIALQTQTIDQVAAVVEYAAGQAVDGIQAWGPGFVFQRVSRPPSDAQRPQDGWAKPRPEWTVAKGRQAERERREREERRQDAERQLRQRRGEMEAFYGPVIDRLYREDKRHLWGLLTLAEKLQVQACGGSFTSRGAREVFLLAAIEGRFETCE